MTVMNQNIENTATVRMRIDKGRKSHCCFKILQLFLVFLSLQQFFLQYLLLRFEQSKNCKISWVRWLYHSYWNSFTVLLFFSFFFPENWYNLYRFPAVLILPYLYLCFFIATTVLSLLRFFFEHLSVVIWKKKRT